MTTQESHGDDSSIVQSVAATETEKKDKEINDSHGSPLMKQLVSGS